MFTFIYAYYVHSTKYYIYILITKTNIYMTLPPKYMTKSH